MLTAKVRALHTRQHPFKIEGWSIGGELKIAKTQLGCCMIVYKTDKSERINVKDSQTAVGAQPVLQQLAQRPSENVSPLTLTLSSHYFPAVTEFPLISLG